MTEEPTPHRLGFAARIVDLFLTSNLSILLLLASIAAGAVALIATPREEDPQISVPMADIMVQMPGASAAEVENLVTVNLEKRLWEMDGVSHVYSVSRPGMAMVTVRFAVGYDRTKALVEIYNKLESNRDAVPPGVTGWIVKPVAIDDVPILTLTLYSAAESDAQLRRIADELLFRLEQVPQTGPSFVVGGRPRQLRVMLDSSRLAGHDVSPLEVARMLQGADARLRAGSFARDNRQFVMDSGPFLRSAGEAGDVVVAIHRGQPVYLRDVARIVDGPAEATDFVNLGFGPARNLLRDQPGHLELPAMAPGAPYPAVTLAFAKRQGTNAVAVAAGLLQRIDGLKAVAIPSDVGVLVTRDYGATANDKVDELVRELFIAIGIIVLLLALSLGGREAFIVALAVPITLSITLLGNQVAGYTINRVTLFALILSLGLLVDDPIVDVENIHRHFQLREAPPRLATLIAVDEVRPPTILATFTVIIAFLPMLFVSGMMGPYMRPMPLNVPMAMLMSLLVAFTITPWATYHLLKHEYDHPRPPEAPREGEAVRRWYGRLLRPLLESRRRARLFLAAIGAALVGSILLVVFGLVPVKMLPFDNKTELNLVIDMPQGTPLEATNAVVRDFEALLGHVAEVTDYEGYAGIASPFDFNGMVRHYYQRQAPWQADIRINLAPKERRARTSHEVALWLLPHIQAIAKRDHVRLAKLVESPPGPPVLASVVAEIYGPPEAEYGQLIDYGRRLKRIFAHTAGLVSPDDFAIDEQPHLEFSLDRQKAALNGVSTAQVAQTLAMVLGGAPAGTLHIDAERDPLIIELRMARPQRSSLADLLAVKIRGASQLVPLGELGSVRRTVEEQPIYHKDLRRVAMVMAGTAGISPVNEVLWLGPRTRQLVPPGYTIDWSGEGEWHITVQVFRDLGLAFAAALFFIYVLLVGQTGSMALPLIIMAAIPLTLIGIMPGFFLLNLLTNHPVAGYPDPTFFTATAMIGMIALAGIVVRNSIILIDFIHLGLGRGLVLEAAILEAGAVRLRPILLTACAAVLGSLVITLDPIFSGLAWSFIFGIFASTGFTLLVVPLIYYLVYRERPA